MGTQQPSCRRAGEVVVGLALAIMSDPVIRLKIELDDTDPPI
jgi:hypothetical protein